MKAKRLNPSESGVEPTSASHNAPPNIINLTPEQRELIRKVARFTSGKNAPFAPNTHNIHFQNGKVYATDGFRMAIADAVYWRSELVLSLRGPDAAKAVRVNKNTKVKWRITDCHVDSTRTEPVGSKRAGSETVRMRRRPAPDWRFNPLQLPAHLSPTTWSVMSLRTLVDGTQSDDKGSSILGLARVKTACLAQAGKGLWANLKAGPLLVGVTRSTFQVEQDRLKIVLSRNDMHEITRH